MTRTIPCVIITSYSLEGPGTGNPSPLHFVDVSVVVMLEVIHVVVKQTHCGMIQMKLWVFVACDVKWPFS